MIPRLCYISDGARGTAGRPLADVIAGAARGGVGMVIVRERQLEVAQWRDLAQALAPLRRAGLRVLTSRRLDLVRALGLDGVQLAADAVPVDEARRWLGPDIWIGYSAHSGQEARLAAAQGVSFVTLSPIHDTESKPGTPGRGTGWLANETRGLSVPALALGGMTADRAGAALAAGAWGVAAVSAIGAASDPERAAREFTNVVEGTWR